MSYMVWKKKFSKVTLLHQYLLGIRISFLMFNFLLRKAFHGNVNEAISVNEIASFRFPRKIFRNRKLTIRK